MAASDYGVGNGQNENYQQNNTSGSGQGPRRPGGNMLVDKYGGLNARQRGQFDDKADYNRAREAFSNAKASGANTSKSSRMAGERLRDAGAVARQERADGGTVSDATRSKLQKNKDKIYGDIDNFDASAAGSGGQRGTNKLSKRDMKELKRRHGAQAVIDMVDNDKTGMTQGETAQNFLAKMRGRVEERMNNKAENGNGGNGGNGGSGGNGGNNNAGSDGGGSVGGGSGDDGNTSSGPTGSGGSDQNIRQDNDNTVTQGGNTGGMDLSMGNQNTIGEINNDSSITNNNNQNIDNSNMVIGRGGDRVMNITTGGNNAGNGSGGVAGALDGVATAGTLGGMYSPDDSLAANMKFVAGYDGMNKQLQKPYQGIGKDTANQYIQNARTNDPLDTVALDQRIADRQLYHQDQATIQENKTLGDSWRYTPTDYKMPNALDNVDYSDKLGENATEHLDRIEDM